MNRNEFQKLKQDNVSAITNVEGSISKLQQDMATLKEQNFKFYSFIENDYYDLDERVTKLERSSK